MADLEKAPTADEGTIRKVFGALNKGLVPGTLPYLEHFDATAKQRGLIPSAHLGPFGRIRDTFSSDAQSLMKEQDTLTALGEGMLGKLADMTAKQEFAKQAGPSPEIAAAQYGVPLLPSQRPGPSMPDPRTSDALATYDSMMRQQQGADLQQLIPPGSPDRSVIGQSMKRIGQLMPAASVSPQALMDPTPMPPTETTLRPYQVEQLEDVRAGRGQFEGNQFIPMPLAKLPGSMMSPDQANAALKAFGVEGVQPFTESVPTSFINEMMKQQRGEGQPAIVKEQTELSRLQRIPETQRTPSHHAMIQTLQDSINRQTALNPDNDNAWAGALFGPNVTYKNLSTQRPVTAKQSQQWSDLHNITIPPGTSPLAAVKAAQVQTQGQVLGYAGAQAKGEAQLDIPLGPKANDYRKLTPDGRIVQAGPRQTPRQAGQQNYVDIKGYEDTIERAQTVRVTEDRVRDVQKLGMEIFKADPGILSKGRQIVELSLSSFANAGKKIGYTVDGKPLTLGEGVNLYNGKVKQMLEAVARSVNAVKGAGTEGDIVRQLEGFPQANVDTALTAKAKYDSLLGTFVNSRRALYSTVFGEEAADAFAKQASGGKVKTPDERMDEIESLLKERLGKS